MSLNFLGSQGKWRVTTWKHHQNSQTQIATIFCRKRPRREPNHSMDTFFQRKCAKGRAITWKKCCDSFPLCQKIASAIAEKSHHLAHSGDNLRERERESAAKILSWGGMRKTNDVRTLGNKMRAPCSVHQWSLGLVESTAAWRRSTAWDYQASPTGVAQHGLLRCS